MIWGNEPSLPACYPSQSHFTTLISAVTEKGNGRSLSAAASRLQVEPAL